MKLHVFNDPHGFNLNMTVERSIRSGWGEDNQFINLTDRTIFKHDAVRYLKRKLSVFRRFLAEQKNIEAVHFYPLDHAGAAFLQQLLKHHKPGRISWVFWSYELYHEPALYPSHFDDYSRPWHREPAMIRTYVSNGIKKILGRPVYDKIQLQNARKMVTHFYSFLKEDYLNAYKDQRQRPEWSRIAFYSIDEISFGEKPGGLTKEIMVGHAATAPSNHETILRKITAIPTDNKVFIPMVYGDSHYGEHIRNVATELVNGRVSYLDYRLETKEYFRRLRQVGFAVFNFHFQEGLGNLLFLIWNGAKVFLNEQSTPYKEFKSWGLKVFSFEKDLDQNSLQQLLSVEDRESNRRIIESIASEEAVIKYWVSLSI